MCFQFIVAPVITMAPSSAWAETDEEKEVRVAKEKAELAAKEAEAEAKRKADEAAAGAEVDKDGHKYREGGEDAGKDATFYANQVIVLAQSCIGANILVSCALATTQPSLMLYMTGSFVHIASEITGAKALNRHHERSAKDLALKEEELRKAAGDGSLQKTAVEAMLAEEKNTKQFLEDRKTWMIAIAVIYWAAVLSALGEVALPGDAGCGPIVPLYTGTAMAISAAYGFAMNATNDEKILQIGTPMLAVLTLIPQIGSFVSLAYGQASARVITFGVSAGIATWITVEIGNKIEKVNENIDKLTKLLADGFKQDAPDEGPKVETDPGTDAPDGPDLDGDKYEVTSFEDEIKRLPRHCGKAAGNGKGTSFSEDCSKPMRFSPIKFDPKFGNPIPGDVSNQISELADATSNGDTARANVLAGELASNAGRMRALAEKMQDDFNSKLKKAGKKEIDFKGEMKKKMASMIQDYNKAAAATKGAPTVSGQAVLDAKVPTAAATATPAGALGKTAAKGATGIDPLKGVEDTSPATLDPNAGANSPSLSDSLNQFESSESDINKQSDVSIFSLISNRYVLNYERVMNRKEAPKAEEPAKAVVPPKSQEAGKK